MSWIKSTTFLFAYNIYTNTNYKIIISTFQ